MRKTTETKNVALDETRVGRATNFETRGKSTI